MVGSPTTEDDAEWPEGADAYDKEKADVDVARDLKPGAKGDGAHRSECSGHGKDRGEPKNELVGGIRNEVFLNEEFQGVGDWLQQAVRAYAHGAETCLHVGHDLALDENDVAGDERDDEDDQYGAE